LWTVAVFLFGALPVMRTRGLGRLLIGDEFDTTRRVTHAGITHYDGLYDQSRYFDNALTRYYRKKAWGIHQFSILRSLSEMLIEKILVERYPDLQALQTSCHATHLENGRVRPCGRCEKCRRIVGMLTALGADPGRCGYTISQIAECLAGITPDNIHQESAGVQQMIHLLVARGVINPPGNGRKIPDRPAVLKVRIDQEVSPVEDLPTDLRAPLFTIILEHAQGAVQRTGRAWIDLDLLNDRMLERPCPHEPRHQQQNGRGRSDPSPGEDSATYLLGEMTWPEARDRLRETDIALLPVGSIEQHGAHLPLDTDAYDAGYLAREVAAACSVPPPLVLPLISYGVSYHHDEFPGTISISNETLASLVYEIGMSAAHNGIAKLVILNAHGGNTPSLQMAAQKINRDARIFTCVDTGETSDPDIARLTETPNDVHAGEVETSTSLANRAHLVRLPRARRSVPNFSSHFLEFSARRRVEWFARTTQFSSTGVIGDPTRATLEKGEKMWAIMIANLVELIEDLKGLSLSEIFDRSY
jgi:creatinine amidohydrolase/Fe(II)-dependent formamide hydrolase-like protein